MTEFLTVNTLKCKPFTLDHPFITVFTTDNATDLYAVIRTINKEKLWKQLHYMRNLPPIQLVGHSPPPGTSTWLKIKQPFYTYIPDHLYTHLKLSLLQPIYVNLSLDYIWNHRSGGGRAHVHDPNSITLLSAALPHFRHERLDTFSTRNIATAPPLEGTQAASSQAYDNYILSNLSNASATAGGFVCPPTKCCCSLLDAICQKYPQDMATRCAFCYLDGSSSSPETRGEYFRDILPRYISQSSSSFPQRDEVQSSPPPPPSYSLIRPVFSYSQAVRITVSIEIVSPPSLTLFLRSSDDTQAISIILTTLHSLREHAFLRSILFNTPVMAGSMTYFPLGLPNTFASPCGFLLHVTEVYPNNVVIGTATTVIRIQDESLRQLNDILCPDSLSMAVEKAGCISAPISKPTIETPIPTLSPLPRLATQATSVQILVKSLWVMLNKYFYTATPSLDKSAATSPYGNLDAALINGMLLYGAPGVGKTYAVSLALSLLSRITSTSVVPPAPPAESPSTVYGLPILHRLSLFDHSFQPSFELLSLPVIRLCVIDSSSLGRFELGVSEKRIDDVFHYCQQRQITATVSESIRSSGGVNGIPVAFTHTSAYTTSDRVFPLMSLKLFDRYAMSSQDNSNSHPVSATISCFTVLTVLLIDEIDSICKAREMEGTETGSAVSLTNHMLTVLDGFHKKSSNTLKPTYVLWKSQQDPHSAVVLPDALLQGHADPSQSLPSCPLFVVGTTNNPDNVDVAIKRSGRLDQMVHIPPPDSAQRLVILQSLLQDVPLDSRTVDLELISEVTVGYVAADLYALCRTAKLHAMKQCIEGIAHPGLRSASDLHDYADVQVDGDHFFKALSTIGAASLRDAATAAFNMKKLTSLTPLSSNQPGNPDAVNIHTCFPLDDEQERCRQLVGSFGDEIGGLYTAKLKLLESVVWPIRYRKQCQDLGLIPSRGILLHGPPGTGKTSLARAVCSSLSATFIPLDMASVFESYLGESERLLRETFRQAYDARPSIIFIDELDSIVSKREMGDGGGVDVSNDVQGRILSTLLNEMDGIESRDGVLVFAATNRLDLIDHALLRPGRFDEIILVPNPDLYTIYEILRVHLRRAAVSPLVDLIDLTKRCYTVLNQCGLGASGANVAAVISEAANHAMKRYIQQAQVKASSKSLSSDDSRDTETGPQQDALSFSLWNTSDDNIHHIIQQLQLDDYILTPVEDSSPDKSASSVSICQQDFDAYFAPLERLISSQSTATHSVQ